MINLKVQTLDLNKWLWLGFAGLFLFMCLLILMPRSGFVHATSTVPTMAAKFDGTRRALLVSVSEYPSLPKYRHLKGPAHDAELVWSTLRDNGFENDNITVLADNVEVDGAKRPTLSAITGALDSLASDVKAGDFVYVHFAGHGSQQPARKKDGADAEADGLDEIFLPADIGAWNDNASKVDNALEDNVVGEKLAAIRDKGAFVWVVFDSCHSGTMTRAVNVEERDRRISPTELGVPDKELDKSMDDAVRTRGAPTKELPLDNVTQQGNNERGGMVAFYAAQTTETTPEMRLPRGQEGRRSHGLFTFTIMEVIAQNPGITYRQASQEILNRYSALNRNNPTPLFEGTDLDAPVFGTEATSAIQQWKLNKEGSSLTVKAGSIHNVNKNSVLAVLPGPTSKDEDVIGYVNVTKASTLKSAVAVIEHEDKKPLKMEDIPDGAYVRMSVPAISMVLSVALPPKTTKKLQATLDKIQKDKDAGLQIVWVSAKEDADLRLYEHNQRVYMLPPSAEFYVKNPGNTPSLSMTKADFQEKLLTNLTRVAKVTNLMRLTTQMGSGGQAGQGAQVELEMMVTRKATGKKETLDGASVPTLVTGDKVALKIKNNKPVAVDVTLLFVSSDYGIESVYPYQANDINRIEAGKELAIPGFSIDASSSAGYERLVMIAVEAEKNSPTSDFTFLSQAALESTRSVRAGKSSLHGLLEQAGFGQENTRGISREPATSLERGSMDVYGWTTSK